MKELKHPKRAADNAAVLIEQARAAGLTQIVAQIEPRRTRLLRLIGDAERYGPQSKMARDMRTEQHRLLSLEYDESTALLQKVLKGAAAAPYVPASHIDVVERVRYRIELLTQSPDGRLGPLAERAQRSLAAYETALFDYLRLSAKAQWLKNRAIYESQHLRRRCERAKATVLRALPAGSPAYQSLKKIPMRTRPTRWFDDLVTDTGVPMRSWSS